ncbi:hypothetical protein ANCCAN_08059 [Ancylostoma caninum]|uniref:SCP domain-containing protein n=1 Tax=Ancylostoma caninum TaxID=29170 RepID=A0A368GNJ5_ANCCA|nr:hypothetical protein ANCCAN_08059 [Ancylostoma caninum]
MNNEQKSFLLFIFLVFEVYKSNQFGMPTNTSSCTTVEPPALVKDVLNSYANRPTNFTYYVNGAQHAKAQGDCANTNYVPDNGNSLNYFKGSYEDTNEQVLEKAIKSWWSQLKGVDVPDNGELNNDIVTKAPFFANVRNMAHEEATKVGCSVVNCASKGYAVAICEYNSIAPQDGDPLYTVGKTCSKCDKRECEPAGGLCST